MNLFSKRGLGVTFQAVFVLFITTWNAIRIYSTIANWQVLREFGANPAYILGVGLVWTLTGLWLFRALWERHNYAIRAGLLVSGLYFIWYWIDRLVLQPVPAPNSTFSVFISVIFLAIFIANLTIPSAKAFFKKETGERENEH